MRRNPRRTTEQEIRAFLDKLRTIRILDPACGTGNFLYVSLDLLKGLEQEVITRLVDVAGQVQLNVLEQINPSQFLGIEINPRAAAIAELVIWIGYLQWYFKRYGNAEPPEPVLQAFGNIENRDAVLAYDGREPDVDPKTGQVRTRWGGRMMTHPVTGEEVPDPEDQVVIYRYLNPRPAEWPEADYVVSNPPFIGNRRMREALGDGYAESVRENYEAVPETVDYVFYWWHQAAELTRSVNHKLQRFGLITTDTIRQTWQRKLLEFHLNHKTPLRIFFAVPDHPWSDDGAAVRIAMTGAEAVNKSENILPLSMLGNVTSEAEASTPEDEADYVNVRWERVGRIYSNLRAGVDLGSAVRLQSNKELCCPGIKLHGIGFVLSEGEAKEIEEEVVFPYINGRDFTQTSRNAKVIDLFGLSEEEVLQKYPHAYQWVYNRVKPDRDQNNRASYREKWWIFGEPRASFRPALSGLPRYIGTPQTSKHRAFAFISGKVVPDQQIIVIASEDAYLLGVLSSNIHICWALSAGGRLEDRPRYNNSVCFDPFPFPDPTPEQKQNIRDLGERLDAHRKQVQATHPDITITGMYNLLEKLRAGEAFTDKDRDYNNRALVSTLKQIHDDLDTAVLDAYGWPHDLTDEQILENLVALNAQRAEEERNGLIRWLRPEYQAPNESPLSRSGRGAGGEGQQTTLEGIIAPEEPVVEPVEQQKWPTQPKAQLAAIRDLLRTTPGDWTTKQIAAQFKGRTTPKKLDAITENLERLEWFGLVIPDRRDGLTYWHYADTAKAA